MSVRLQVDSPNTNLADQPIDLIHIKNSIDNIWLLIYCQLLGSGEDDAVAGLIALCRLYSAMRLSLTLQFEF